MLILKKYVLYETDLATREYFCCLVRQDNLYTYIFKEDTIILVCIQNDRHIIILR